MLNPKRTRNRRKRFLGGGAEESPTEVAPHPENAPDAKSNVCDFDLVGHGGDTSASDGEGNSMVE